ncbi:hypothetical protein B0H13DRAFT_1877662 [Mycena leptocephala]|nr:hypothetical protein B0H13DRAFT_1877662 [Mycena leptocephala]
MSLYNFMFTEGSWMDQPWFIDAETGRKFTGTAIKSRTDALALGLNSLIRLESTSNTFKPHQDCGIRDVVGVVSPNCLDFGTVVWAAHKLGCTVASIFGGSTVDELKYQFSLSGSRTVFTHIDALQRVIRAADECSISLSRIVVISDTSGLVLPSEVQTMGIVTVEELIRLGEEENIVGHSTATTNQRSPIAFLCFSSGTTGLPKAVILPHSAIIANVIQLKNASVPGNRVLTGDTALGVIPFSHIFGLVTLVHLCPHLGIATVVFKSMPSFNILLEKLVQLRIGHLFLAPPLVNAFVKHPATSNYDLTFLRSAMIAAAPLDGDSESAFQRLWNDRNRGVDHWAPHRHSASPGSVGKLLSFTDAKIIDEYGTAVLTGHSGHLCVRGPQLCLGYLGNTEATQNAFDADGFLFTGDIAHMTADGYFHIVDRAKCMIKNKGYQVSPAELEAHLLRLPLIDDAGVVGKPDDRCGEVPVAFVVLSALGRQQANQDVDPVKNEIKCWVQQEKSNHKWVHDVHFVQEIPRLPSGKIAVKHMKQMLTVVEPLAKGNPTELGS